VQKVKCPKCQFENREAAKFCKDCGANLEVACSECGTIYVTGSKFCDECGLKFDHEIDPTKSGISSDGERKHVTVLFSDLSGYTTMSERLDPEEVKEITGLMFDNVAKIVNKYDGFIEKYAGDAVMALFGANQSHEDDPVRAIKAAQEIHGWVESKSPQYEDSVGQPLVMHTGITTGLVVTGELNLEKGVHGTAGDTINVAARLSGAASSGDILVDYETYKRSEGYFRFEDLEPIRLKGKTKPVQVHKFLSTKVQPQKIHRLHGLRAELIGRKAEMGQLKKAVDNLKQGKGAVFSIMGTAGTGKSRLVEEFKASLDLKKIQWREGHAFPYAQNIPYFPLIDLISKTIRIDEGDSPNTVKEKLESSLEVIIGKEQDIAPYIGNLFALDYPEIDDVSPEFWKTELQKAILKVLTALAQRASTVICLEDLHWADPSTLELVHFLLSEIRHPVLFLFVYRPTISPFSAHQIKAMAIPHQELLLRDLSPTETQNMVESLLKTDAIPKDLQRFIEDKVEGNPFYLEEAINSLIESNILVAENGDWKVSGPITESEISATIQGVISARVDRLEKESKRILQEASVIGKSFYYQILERISEIKDNIDRNLSGLERFDFIKTKSIQPYLEYVFKHALTQEVVYNGLLKKERREIHERIGCVIEELFKDRLPEFYETMAFHFRRSRSIQKAVDYLMKSGEKSLKRYAVEESHKYYQEAYELLVNQPIKISEESEQLIDLLSHWAMVYYYRGDFKGLTDLLLVNEDLATSLKSKAKVGMFYAWLGFAVMFRGKHKESYRYLCTALELGEEANNKRVVGYACTWLTWTCTNLGKMEEAIAHGEKAQEISKLLPEDQYLFFKSLSGLGYAYYFKANKKKLFDAGITLLDHGRKHSNIRCMVMGNWVMFLGHQLDGNFQAAVELYNSKIGNVAIDPFYSKMETLYLGVSYFLNNQYQESEEPLNEFLNYSRQTGCEVLENVALMPLGVITIAKGYMSQGLELLKKVQQKLLSSENQPYYAQSEYVLGMVYLQIVVGAGPKKLSTMIRNMGFIIKNVPLAHRKAEAHFKKAIEVAKKIGAKNILAQSYLDLGNLHKTKKRTEIARECISEAIQIFEECEMEVFLKQAKEAIESIR
jgi:class 3 adenylate cyclase/tetratricopeptide (TPR) repeat protein